MLTWEYPPRIVGGIARVVHDLSKRLIKSIDKNTLTVQNNFMQKSPYENRAFYMISLQKHDNMFKLLKNLWNGKFDFIR